jgi:hypothetical protein
MPLEVEPSLRRSLPPRAGVRWRGEWRHGSRRHQHLDDVARAGAVLAPVVRPAEQLSGRRARRLGRARARALRPAHRWRRVRRGAALRRAAAVRPGAAADDIAALAARAIGIGGALRLARHRRSRRRAGAPERPRGRRRGRAAARRSGRRRGDRRAAALHEARRAALPPATRLEIPLAGASCALETEVPPPLGAGGQSRIALDARRERGFFAALDPALLAGLRGSSRVRGTRADDESHREQAEHRPGPESCEARGYGARHDEDCTHSAAAPRKEESPRRSVPEIAAAMPCRLPAAQVHRPRLEPPAPGG